MSNHTKKGIDKEKKLVEQNKEANGIKSPTDLSADKSNNTYDQRMLTLKQVEQPITRLEDHPEYQMSNLPMVDSKGRRTANLEPTENKACCNCAIF